MISLKTVFNYIKFANELTNKVSFMFNGIKKYVVRIVCVIMLLLVQFDVCAPLIALSTCWSIFLLFPKFRYKVTHLSVKIRGKWYIITLSFVCTAFNMSH